jgi:hypothetical protein
MTLTVDEIDVVMMDVEDDDLVAVADQARRVPQLEADVERFSMDAYLARVLLAKVAERIGAVPGQNLLAALEEVLNGSV